VAILPEPRIPQMTHALLTTARLLRARLARSGAAPALRSGASRGRCRRRGGAATPARTGGLLASVALLAGCATSPCLREKPPPTVAYFETLHVASVEVRPAPEDAPAVKALREAYSKPHLWIEGRPVGTELYAAAPAWRVRWVVRDRRIESCAAPDPRTTAMFGANSCDPGLVVRQAAVHLHHMGWVQPHEARDAEGARAWEIEATVIDPSQALPDAPADRVARICPLLFYSELLSVRLFDLPPTDLPSVPPPPMAGPGSAAPLGP